jgi:hypothetical protein
MSGNRRRRLEKLEQKLVDLARQEALANCNCQALTFATSTKALQAEMSKTCPVHGFRRLGQIYIVQIVDTSPGRSRKIDEKSIGLDELAQEYERRLAEVEQAEDEREYDRQEP